MSDRVPKRVIPSLVPCLLGEQARNLLFLL
jgi:hypothetical protein